MAKFAVYIIPPAESEMFQHGSEILGYDVRTGRFLPEDNPTRAALPEFAPAWIQRPQTYGFHVTTGYSLFFDLEKLPAIETEIEHVLNCFSPDVQFTLTPDSDERIPFWGRENDIAVLHYQPNPALMMLHAMLIARVNPYGTTSSIAEHYREDPTRYPAVNVHRVRQYYTPYMLDGWVPHFTLMQPYSGDDKAGMRQALYRLFSDEVVDVHSICLLVMPEGETHYRLHREFLFEDFPRPID